MTEDQGGGRPRLTLVALLVVFLAPPVGAWLWFQFGDGFSARNYGQLFEPARPLADVLLAKPGSQEAESAPRGQWYIAYFSDGPCEAVCLEQVDKINRVRLSQAKNVKRINTLLITPTDPDGSVRERVSEIAPTAVILAPAAEALPSLRRTLSHPGEEVGQAAGRVYLIDPIGNLVLSYPADADPKKMRKDISRLLRVSQIG